MKAFKDKYSVQNVSQKHKEVDHALSIDEYFLKTALASRQKIQLNNKNTDYNQQLPFKGQLSSNRYIPLTEVKDFEQLKKISVILETMETEIEAMMVNYAKDATRHEKQRAIDEKPKMASKLLKGMFKS